MNQRLAWQLLLKCNLKIFFGGQQVACTIPILCQISSASFEPTQSTMYHCQLLEKLELGCCSWKVSLNYVFLASLIVEEIIVEFMDIKDTHIISQSHRHGIGWGRGVDIVVVIIEANWKFKLRKSILGQKWVDIKLSNQSGLEDLMFILLHHWHYFHKYNIGLSKHSWQSNIFQITCYVSSSIMGKGSMISSMDLSSIISLELHSLLLFQPSKLQRCHHPLL